MEFKEKTTMKIKTVAIAATMLASASIAAYSHGGATGIVKERMDGMSAMGEAIKVLSKMMRGEAEYDAAQIIQGAAVISSHSGNKLTKLFEPGSNAKPSVSRDEIWTSWDEFKELADRLGILANGLEAAAGNGLMNSEAAKGSMMGTAASTMMGAGKSTMMTGGMMGKITEMPSTEMLAGMPTDAVFNMVTQTCSSCHTKFRLEKK